MERNKPPFIIDPSDQARSQPKSNPWNSKKWYVRLMGLVRFRICLQVLGEETDSFTASNNQLFERGSLHLQNGSTA